MKKDCDKYADDLSALIDGELTAAWRAEIEAHVTGCADCRARVAELRKLSAGIVAIPKMRPPQDFLTEVRRRISEGKQPLTASWWEIVVQSSWVQVPVRVAAVVAILVGIAALITPAYNSYVNRYERGQLVKAKRPLEMAARAESSEVPAAPVGRQSVAQPNESVASPAATPAPELALAEKKTMFAFDEVADGKLQASIEKILIEAPDMGQVQVRATQVVLALGGRVTVNPIKQVPTDKPANSFYVELPTRNAATFRDRLVNQYAPRKDAAERAPANGNESDIQRMATSELDKEALSNEPTSVLEIQVVTPAK